MKQIQSGVSGLSLSLEVTTSSKQICNPGPKNFPRYQIRSKAHQTVSRPTPSGCWINSYFSKRINFFYFKAFINTKSFIFRRHWQINLKLLQYMKWKLFLLHAFKYTYRISPSPRDKIIWWMRVIICINIFRILY